MQKIREAEFIALVAAMMSMVALTIDAILPAFAVISRDFALSAQTEIQLMVTLVFAGITIGQLIYGPIADRAGRKPTFAIGMGIFLAGSLLSAVTSSFALLLAGRFLQGFGAASFRISAMAVVRDQYEGAEMARITSFAMSLFMIVPCLAPLIGQGLLIWFDWRVIFVVQLVLGVGLLLWFWFRQPETLPELTANRPSIASAFRETLTTPIALFYTIAAGMMLGSFMGFLVSSHHILTDIYGAGQQFALYFAALSIVMGIASFTNGKIVRKYDPRRLARVGLVIAMAASGLALIFLNLFEMTLLWFLVHMAAVLSCMGFIFGNMNAIAVQPLGHIAGVATSSISFLSGLISVCIGSFIGSQVSADSPEPLFLGFFGASILAFVLTTVVDWHEARRSATLTLVRT